MSVRSKDEIMESIRVRIGDDTGDDALALLEDLSDTMDDLASKATDPENWKEKYSQLDEEWRQRYRDRFYSGEDPAGMDPNDPASAPDPEHLTFESLFKED